MKKAFYGFTLALLLSAGYAQADNYKITGTWANGNGKTVYLCEVTPDGQTVAVDSVVVKDGAFEISGSIEQSDRRVLVVGNSRGNIFLDSQPVQVTITDEQDALTRTVLGDYKVQITGSREQAIFTRWKENMRAVFNMAKLYNNMDEKEMDDDNKMLKDLFNQNAQNFLDTCKNSPAFASIIGDYAESYQEAERLYNVLTPEVKASRPGQWLSKRMEFLRSTTGGEVAPEIELPAPDGTMVKLSSLRGKYVLVDFWASWCGPCMAEAPNVKAIYEDYKDKGFEVFGVSLDTKKEAWEKAIKENGLNWIHVSSLKGSDDVTRAYNVTAIPTTYLLDKEGRIITKNLRGKALRERIEALFIKD